MARPIVTGDARPVRARPGGVDLLLFSAGWILWSAAFVVLYASYSVGCRFGWHQVSVGPVDLNRAALAMLWLLFTVATAALLFGIRKRFARSEPANFTRRAVLLSTAAALVSIVWTGLPILTSGRCGAPHGASDGLATTVPIARSPGG